MSGKKSDKKRAKRANALNLPKEAEEELVEACEKAHAQSLKELNLPPGSTTEDVSKELLRRTKAGVQRKK